MATISISDLIQSTVLYLYTIRDEMQMDPPYQRASDIWSISKKQLLIDSILNGFDIPKLYLHKLAESDPPGLPIAIVDGKQRLEAIWGFIDGEFPLSTDIEFLANPEVHLAGITYQELGRRYPKIKAKFDATRLSVVQVETADVELIEEMFSRLNEAVPLAAAEKRNAFGGPIPEIIRQVAGHSFFTSKLPFLNTRYRHFDLSCKFLLLRSEGAITDTKKIHLDNFVKLRKRESAANPDKARVEATQLESQVRSVLDKVASAFIANDPLLASVGMVVVYYCLYLFRSDTGTKVDRSHLLRFENVRKRNRELARTEDEENPPSYTLLEFDRLMQAPNDASSIRFKVNLLEKYILGGSPGDLKTAISLLAESPGADDGALTLNL